MCNGICWVPTYSAEEVPAAMGLASKTPTYGAATGIDFQAAQNIDPDAPARPADASEDWRREIILISVARPC